MAEEEVRPVTACSGPGLLGSYVFPPPGDRGPDPARFGENGTWSPYVDGDPGGNLAQVAQDHGSGKPNHDDSVSRRWTGRHEHGCGASGVVQSPPCWDAVR